MKIAILGGLGMEGQALLKYLKKHDSKADITLLDQKLDPNYLSNLEQFDLIYRSPGVLYNLPEIQRAIRRGVEFSSPTNLFFEKAKGKIIGITGTKGKGTTTRLVYDILKNAGLEVHLGGNIGEAATDLLDQLTDNSITVLELSNVQLWDIKHSPYIAGVLGIFPDHLDWHKNFRGYLGTKFGITKFQKQDDFVFYIENDKFAKKVAKKSKGHKVAVNPDSIKIPLTIPGEHNRKNAAMAAAICAHVGVKPEIILETIKNYKGLPYRLTKVDTKGGVTYYNDSASTNPQTTCAAVKAFPQQKKILIVGGSDKGLDYKPLRDVLEEEQNVKLVILYGANREKIKDTLGDVVPIKVVTGSLKETVQLATNNASDGDVVVFSPGSASFDMFANYKERGATFDEIVKNI